MSTSPNSFIEAQPVELKYCERCGGLWLRARGCDQPYCPPCAAFVRELPPPALQTAGDGRCA